MKERKTKSRGDRRKVGKEVGRKRSGGWEGVGDGVTLTYWQVCGPSEPPLNMLTVDKCHSTFHPGTLVAQFSEFFYKLDSPKCRVVSYLFKYDYNTVY